MGNYYDFNTGSSYTLGFGVRHELRRLTYRYGHRYLIVHDYHMDVTLRTDIQQSLTQPISPTPMQGDNALGRSAGLLDNLFHHDPNEIQTEHTFYLTQGKHCSYRSIEHLGEVLKAYQPHILVAVGGSKCIDLACAALHHTDAKPRIVLMPTILSSNASTNSMSVIYDESTHEIVDFWGLPNGPDSIIVDTELIIKSNPKSFAAGIGDQIASSLEAIHAQQRLPNGEHCDPLCIAHHQAVLNVLQQYAPAAMDALRSRTPNHAFEWVCHALSRYTGPQLAIATAYFSHVLEEALRLHPSISQRMHGDIVGYGALPQLVAHGTPDDIYTWVDLYEKIGLPTTLTQLGAPNCGYDEVLRCCQLASNKTMAQISSVRWTPEEMAHSVIEADKLVTEYLTQKNDLY